MSWKRDIVVFKQEGVYACFPFVQQLKDGRLVVGFMHRDWPTHHDPGRWRVVVSRDGGEAWAETDDASLQMLWRGKGGGFRTVLPDGTWLTAGAGGWATLPVAERAGWVERGHNTANHETDPGLFYLAKRDLVVDRSSDRGRTWQSQTVPAPTDMSHLFTFRLGATRLGDGTILLGGAGKPRRPGGAGVSDASTSRAYAVRSADGGATWEFVPMAEDPSGRYTEEISLLEVDEGRVLALARVDRPGYLWQQWSADAGRTWSEPVETRIWGYPCHLLRLRDGRVLCTYGYRRPPAGIRAAISDNGGRSWDLANEYVLRDDGGTMASGWSAAHRERVKDRPVPGGSDLGYPVSTQLPDGTIFTIYYITTPDGTTHIAATRWRP